jgi:hypothetical protein
MPRLIRKIYVTDAIPFEGAAWIVSHITYPNDQTRMLALTAALVRMAHNAATKTDNDWLMRAHLVHTWIFQIKEDECQKVLNIGLKSFFRRLYTAHFMLKNHLKAVEHNTRVAPLRGFDPTVENVASWLMPAFGLSEGSFDTFKSRIWGQTRPVSHLAYATSIRWFDFFSNKHINTTNYMSTMFPPGDDLRKIISAAEYIRTLLPKITQFRIREKATIKFVAVGEDMPPSAEKDTAFSWDRNTQM